MPNGWSRPEANTSLRLGLAAPSAARRTRIRPGSDSARRCRRLARLEPCGDRGDRRRTARPGSPARPIWEQCGTSRFSTGRPSIFRFCERGYDEPGILSYAISSFCPTSADGLHRAALDASVPYCSTSEPDAETHGPRFSISRAIAR